VQLVLFENAKVQSDQSEFQEPPEAEHWLLLSFEKHIPESIPAYDRHIPPGT
jgi:hypothetical protein